MQELFAFKERFAERKKAEYRIFISSISTTSKFEDDIWICDKMRRNNSDRAGAYSIYFSTINEKYKDVSKYFTVIKLISRIGILSARVHIVRLQWLFKYASKNSIEDLLQIRNAGITYDFKKYLDENCHSEEQKHGIWASVGNFFNVMNNFYETSVELNFCYNPYVREFKHDFKLIPEEVISQIDIMFIDENVSLHIRVAYWIMRLFPSRVREICAIPIDCLKQFNGDWVLFIPTWKQSGGYKKPEIRTLYFKDTGIGKYLADIIKEQQVVSLNLQEHITLKQKGLLLTYRKTLYRYGSWLKTSLGKYTVLTASPDHINVFFSTYCKIHNILDANSKLYIFKSHQLRHNGITERICEGFTVEQIMHMTAHKNDSMIMNSYSHLNLKPDIMIQKQTAILGETNDVKNAMMFQGRILNMTSHIENRLLTNPRSHRVRGGICSDITNCKCDMYFCLSCEYFIPEVEQLSFFKQQCAMWKEKSIRFKAFPIIVKNADANAQLYNSIVQRIENGEVLQNENSAKGIN